jgi:UDP-2,3-diacylglucosamine hydrolase
LTTLFISDLHLDPDRPLITDLFVDFLEREARHADALFILGDLFEAWVGDDDDAELPMRICASLRVVHEVGVPIGFIRGNRDFLLHQAYADRCGMTLLPDPCVVELAGAPTLLLHGDLLCSDDTQYLAFRRQVRDPDWQQAFLSQSLAARKAFAQQARDASHSHQQGMSIDVGDATAPAVESMFRRFGVHRMIHGHTHRPARHHVDVDGADCERIVLGDWYEHGSVLRIGGNGEIDLRALMA